MPPLSSHPRFSHLTISIQKLDSCNAQVILSVWASNSTLVDHSSPGRPWLSSLSSDLASSPIDPPSLPTQMHANDAAEAANTEQQEAFQKRDEIESTQPFAAANAHTRGHPNKQADLCANATRTTEADTETVTKSPDSIRLNSSTRMISGPLAWVTNQTKTPGFPWVTSAQEHDLLSAITLV
ncbi:unnamed protein product [Protopolystoma xenopodis]|uniref:Uncharacterized protein n=1 Tax=Protopolystoma xenopodis TaxID=117903 RepID=A0A3S5A2K4_9PLAT|nr:unnamed protein product [Protopolystoma xenopodis]